MLCFQSTTPSQVVRDHRSEGEDFSDHLRRESMWEAKQTGDPAPSSPPASRPSLRSGPRQRRSGGRPPTGWTGAKCGAAKTTCNRTSTICHCQLEKRPGTRIVPAPLGPGLQEQPSSHLGDMHEICNNSINRTGLDCYNVASIQHSPRLCAGALCAELPDTAGPAAAGAPGGSLGRQPFHRAA